MSKFKRVTLQDIASAADVSYASVSAVLSRKEGGSIRVGKEKREKIIAISKELGYVPNQVARSLKSNNQTLVSVFTYENMSETLIRDEYYDFFIGVHEESELKGLDVLMLNTRKNIASSSRITLSSGSVMIGVHRDNQDIKFLLQREFPLVFVGRREIEGVKTHWVSFDYKTIIEEMISLVSKSGFSKAAFINSGDESEPYRDKANALFEAADNNNISINCISYKNETEITPEIESFLQNNDVYLVDRIWQIPMIEKYLESHNLILGKDKMGILLEDDWMKKHDNWTRWKNSRKQLGSLALSYLSEIIKGKTPPKNNLVPLEMVVSKSFNI